MRINGEIALRALRAATRAEDDLQCAELARTEHRDEVQRVSDALANAQAELATQQCELEHFRERAAALERTRQSLARAGLASAAPVGPPATEEQQRPALLAKPAATPVLGNGNLNAEGSR